MEKVRNQKSQQSINLVKVYFQFSFAKETHACVSALKSKIDELMEVQETKEIEFKEHLRSRDSKINKLIAKQREFWKYLTNLERSIDSKKSKLISEILSKFFAVCDHLFRQGDGETAKPSNQQQLTK
jgi:regulator of replication initiation timing